jgi:hypothetical protein
MLLPPFEGAHCWLDLPQLLQNLTVPLSYSLDFELSLADIQRSSHACGFIPQAHRVVSLARYGGAIELIDLILVYILDVINGITLVMVP